MSQYRYVTIDGQPPWDGFVPAPNAPLPVGNNGGILGSGIIGIVAPRPDIGNNPNWKPWDNVPGLPTAASTSSSPAPPATRAPVPPAGNVPETDKILRLPSGAGYIFPKDHVTIHVVEPGFFPWDKPRTNFQWRAYKVPISMTLTEFIAQICQLSGEQKGKKKKTDKDLVAKKIYECIELGDGVWGRGIEYCIGDGKGKDEGMKKAVKQTLKDVGWDKRGVGSSPPVWVATEAITK